MEYTVKELAQLAGISVRTLHWYDEIGLLHPCRITQAGYRIYGAKEVDTLQSILFYRALDLPLKDIAALMKAPSFNRLQALQAHRTALCEKRAQLDTLLQTVNKTIAQEEGKRMMTDYEKFEGFKKNLIEKNEAAYGAEIREKYSDATVDASNAKMMNLTEEQYTAMKALENEMKQALETAVQQKLDPSGEEGKRIAAMHKQWLCYSWEKYSVQAHKGLAQMYVADERFTAYYDETVKGCAQFLCDAITKCI